MINKPKIYFSTAVTNYFNLFLGFFSGIIAARLLGPEGRGQLAVIMYFPTLMSSFCCMGLPQAISFKLLKNKDQSNEIIASAFQISLVIGLVGAIIFSCITPWYLSSGNEQLIKATATICFMAIPMVINSHLYAIHRAFYRFFWVNSMLIVMASGYILILIGLWFFNIIEPLNIAFCLMLLHALVLACNILRTGFGTFIVRVKWKTYRDCILQGIRFFLPVLSITLYTVADRAILIKTTTLSEMGYYMVAFAISQPLLLLCTTFHQISFIEVAAKDNCEESACLAWRRFQQVQVIVVAALLIILPLVKPLLMYGFGKEYNDAYGATIVLLIAMALRGLSVTIESSIRAQNYIWPGFLSAGVALIFLVILSFLFVPEHGVIGFSVVMLVAELFSLIVLLIVIKILFNLPYKNLWGFRLENFISLITIVKKIFKNQGGLCVS